MVEVKPNLFFVAKGDLFSNRHTTAYLLSKHPEKRFCTVLNPACDMSGFVKVTHVCSNCTLTIAFEVLTIICQTCFESFFSFNCLTLNFYFLIYLSQGEEKGCYGPACLLLVNKFHWENHNLL